MTETQKGYRDTVLEFTGAEISEKHYKGNFIIYEQSTADGYTIYIREDLSEDEFNPEQNIFMHKEGIIEEFKRLIRRGESIFIEAEIMAGFEYIWYELYEEIITKEPFA